MEVISFMIPIALLLGLVFVIAFIWATKSGQYDDMEGPAARILFEEENINTTQTMEQKEEKHE